MLKHNLVILTLFICILYQGAEAAVAGRTTPGRRAHRATTNKQPVSKPLPRVKKNSYKAGRDDIGGEPMLNSWSLGTDE